MIKLKLECAFLVIFVVCLNLYEDYFYVTFAQIYSIIYDVRI